MTILEPQTTITPGSGDFRWLRSNYGMGAQLGVSIDVALLKSGTHYDADTGVIPAGLPLGKVTATGKYGPYDPLAADGREVLSGFLTGPEQLTRNFSGVTAKTVQAAQRVVGIIDPEFVPTKPTLNNKIKTTGQFIWYGVAYVA